MNLIIYNLYSAIKRLGHFATPILEGISQILGMHATLIVGGPEPARDGQINVLRYEKFKL